CRRFDDHDSKLRALAGERRRETDVILLFSSHASKGDSCPRVCLQRRMERWTVSRYAPASGASTVSFSTPPCRLRPRIVSSRYGSRAYPDTNQWSTPSLNPVAARVTG